MYNDFMRRILLVIEDYNELLYVEKNLKKVGFDVESLPSESSLPERMMGFLPDLVIATGDGNRINGHSVAKKVKRKGVKSLLLLLFPKQKFAQLDIATYAAEGAIETPINPRALIKAVCDYTGIPLAPLLAKFEKFLPQTEPDDATLQFISDKGFNIKADKAYANGDVRSDRYKKLLQGVAETPDKIFNHQSVEDERRLQKSIPDTPEEVALDEKRKDFVKKLYKGWKR
jgi:DNA-binding response OmpR family regulator